MIKKYISLLGIFVLSACASQPPQTLAQQLQGKSVEDKKEILRLACLNEAEWPIYNSSGYHSANPRLKSHIRFSYNEEVSTSKALCRKLHEVNDAKKKRDLAKKGESLIATTLEKHGDAATDHAARTKQIYEYMTGQKITPILK